MGQLKSQKQEKNMTICILSLFYTTNTYDMYKIFAKPFRPCKTKILSGKHPNTSFKHSMWGPGKLYFLTKMV